MALMEMSSIAWQIGKENNIYGRRNELFWYEIHCHWAVFQTPCKHSYSGAFLYRIQESEPVRKVIRYHINQTSERWHKVTTWRGVPQLALFAL